MSIPYFQQGNTARFEGEFYDFTEQLVDPATVKFKVYDSQWTQVFETTIGAEGRTETGKYFFDYVCTPLGDLTFEWYGEINGKPSLYRGPFKIAKV